MIAGGTIVLLRDTDLELTSRCFAPAIVSPEPRGGDRVDRDSLPDDPGSRDPSRDRDLHTGGRLKLSTELAYSMLATRSPLAGRRVSDLRLRACCSRRSGANRRSRGRNEGNAGGPTIHDGISVIPGIGLTCEISSPRICKVSGLR